MINVAVFVASLLLVFSLSAKPVSQQAIASVEAVDTEISVSESVSNPYPYYSEINAVANKYNLPPDLIAGIVKLESNFKPNEVSHVGAIGLMQVMPATGKSIAKVLEMDSYDLFDPEDNLEIGTRFLVALLNKFDGHLPSALSYYNGGNWGVISKHNYRNQRYVQVVLDNYWNYALKDI